LNVAPAHRWDDLPKETHALQLMLDFIEKQKKKEHGFAESLIPKA
jgi:hypothetical protein